MYHLFFCLGKGENIWDRFCHVGDNIEGGDTGDVACDSYNLFQRDIEMMVEMEASDERILYYIILLYWCEHVEYAAGRKLVTIYEEVCLIYCT